MADPVRKRRLPIVGEGGGVWPTSIEDVAAATAIAGERSNRDVYYIFADEPARRS